MSRNSAPIAYLPPHLDRLLDRGWNPEANRQIDRWLWYAEAENLPTSPLLPVRRAIGRGGAPP